MKIEVIDLFYVALPKITRTADGTQDSLVVRIRTDNGLEGWGECDASPLVSMTAYVMPMSHSNIININEALIGETLDSPEDVIRLRNKAGEYGLDIQQLDHAVAGADIAMMRDKSFVDVFAGDLFTPETDQIMRVRKPIIAAVSGYALGGGCELAMMCDFIICSESAKFGQPEINLGVVAGIGGTQRLTRAIGKSKAMDMNLTGRFMDAAEAERAGLVSRVVPVKKLMEEAMAAAAKIAEKSMISTMVVKEAVNRSFEVPLREGLLFERRIFHSLFATEDQKEGMSAFLEKREAQFRDK